ncbi:MAG TPA: ABC transporter ATP-binding protein [Desulfofustis sp.]|nr:ABC transporter ATP-binding protein [Desulfofustis sp.]
MLVVENLVVRYGPVAAVKGIDLAVGENEMVSLLGANGAGKSTTLLAIAGAIRPHSGRILFDGADITGMKAEKAVAAGIAMVPETRDVFADLTVRENLLLGGFIHRRRRAACEQEMESLMTMFPVLRERMHQPGGTLSGGEQQMLAVGRAYMSGRKIMILDEPSMGLAPLLMLDMFDALKEINRQGTTILLVEQNARLALKFAQRGYVLENGHLVLQGEANALLDNPNVKKAYLGA